MTTSNTPPPPVTPSGYPWLGGLAAVFVGLALAFLPLNGLLWVGIALLGAAAGLLTIKYPLFGLALTLIIAPFGAYENRLGLVPGPFPSGQLMLFAILTIWAGRWLALRRRDLPDFPLKTPLFIFIGVTLFSLLDAPSLPLGLKEIIKWVEILLIIWLVLDLVPLPSFDMRGKQRGMALLLTMILLPPLIQALIGIGQFIQPDGPESFLILGRFYRAFGTFEQPNPFGGYIALHALLIAGIVLTLLTDSGARLLKVMSGKGQGFSLKEMPLLGVLLAVGGLLAIALVGSWSRGAWLGFAAGGAAIAVFWPRRRSIGISLALGTLLLGLLVWQAGLIPVSLSSRIESVTDFQLRDLRELELTGENYALLERLAFWEAAAGMARSQLWFGVGFGNYDSAYPDFSQEGWPQSLGHAHNYYLNLLAEVGIFGLAAYLIFWGAVFWQNIRLLGRLDGFPRGIALGLMGVWTAFAVHHLVDKLYVNNFYLQVAVLLAVQQLLIHLESEGETLPNLQLEVAATR